MDGESVESGERHEDAIHDRWSAIEKAAASLNSSAARLRILNIFVLFLTVLNLSVMLIGSLFLECTPEGIVYPVAPAICSVSIAALVFVTLGQRQIIRRRGQAISQELSDEVQSFIVESQKGWPRLQVRVAIRSFEYSGRMPFGEMNPIVTYGALNLFFAGVGVALFHILPLVHSGC